MAGERRPSSNTFRRVTTEFPRKRASWGSTMTIQHHPNVKVVRVEGEAAAATSHHDKEKITVAIDAELLECGVCFGPLTPPLFQCTKGHISCSECCTDGALDYDCLMCREPETATRCRVMERILDGLSVPCAFRQHGCAEMVPYADKQDHVASCIHAPCHCPIAGCAGYTGASLRDHIKVDHPAVQSTLVRLGCLTSLRMRGGEPARVACLGNGRTEFLLVVGQDVPSGRTLSVLHLMDEPSDDEDFKYKIEVVGEAGVLSLSGQAEGVERLTKPYQASAFLFVPNAIWDSSPEDVPVFIELK